MIDINKVRQIRRAYRHSWGGPKICQKFCINPAELYAITTLADAHNLTDEYVTICVIGIHNRMNAGNIADVMGVSRPVR